MVQWSVVVVAVAAGGGGGGGGHRFPKGPDLNAFLEKQTTPSQSKNMCMMNPDHGIFSKI